MSKIETVRDLVGLWPTRADLANDLKTTFPDMPVSVSQVQKWAEKQSIPARYQHPVLVAARQRGFDITADLIVEMHAVARSAA